MKNFIFIFLTLSYVNLRSQTNLVLNPSFENHSGCPGNVGELDKANFWDTFSGSCDLFTPCGMDPNVVVPGNAFGYQYAHTGNSYAGLIAYYDAVYYHEVMGVKLQSSLTTSQKYFFSFYISRGTKLTGYGINNVGIKLTQTNSFTTTSASNMGQLVNNTAHFANPTVISDTLNWVQVKGSFLADSAYQYLMIGNFFDDSNTTVTPLPPGGGYAYYFIDDVCLSTDSVFVSEYAVGVKELYTKGQKVRISPNPAHQNVFVDCPVNSIISLYSSLGTRMNVSPVFYGKGYLISTESLEPGVYSIYVDNRVEKLIVYH